MQIRAGQRSLTTNLWPLTAYIYHVISWWQVAFPRNLSLSFSEAAVCRCSSKQVLLEILQYSQENICVGVSFNKVVGLRPATLFQPDTKRDFNTGVFLWKLQTPFFKEHLWWLLLSVWKSNCSIMISICQSFLNQKQKRWDGFY